MKSREFREIQVSSTQLAVIFLGILVIGVVIFLLGVSVGKKHAQAAVKANVIAQKEPEQVKEKIVSLPQPKPGEELRHEAPEKAAPAPADSTPVKKEIIPKKPEEKPKTEAQMKGPEVQTKTVPPPAPVKKGLYYVQVGALVEQPAAQATAEKFRKLGYAVIVMDPQATDKSPVFRVRVGGFQTREQAEEARQKLASAAGRKVDYFIVRD
jgi:cell division septation protein DedD